MCTPISRSTHSFQTHSLRIYILILGMSADSSVSIAYIVNEYGMGPYTYYQFLLLDLLSIDLVSEAKRTNRQTI
jgi:hypothetical protein